MNLGPGFIAEVKKTLTEASMNNKSLREMSENVLDNLQIREHDVLTQGNRDINTQELIRQIPKPYTMIRQSSTLEM